MDITGFLNQKAWIWNLTSEGDQGQAVFANPVQVNCRIDKEETFVVTKDGRTVKATSAMLVLDRPTDGSYMIAVLDSLNAPAASPVGVANAWPILKILDIYDLDGILVGYQLFT
jgi:hypothetical protein